MRKLLKRDEGFTLIELMVVVLIIGILVAIALPTFLGARNRANDKAAQSSVRNALVAAKTCFTDADTYVGCVGDSTATPPTGKLVAIEGSISFVPAATGSLDPNTVSVRAASATLWTASAYSKAGTCWSISDDSTAGTKYNTGGTTAPAAGGCTAPAAALTGASW